MTQFALNMCRPLPKCARENKPSKDFRARPGFEPGTSRTRSENHTPRPTSHPKFFVARLELCRKRLNTHYMSRMPCFRAWSRVAQWKRAGPITQRSVDRNYALLRLFLCLFADDFRSLEGIWAKFHTFSQSVSSFEDELRSDNQYLGRVTSPKQM